MHSFLYQHSAAVLKVAALVVVLYILQSVSQAAQPSDLI